ncbi:hypothetical protein SEA_NUCCI_41 [Microbacterium phage Nucci]|nr:hypothetical protein SEA_NUCCI_41 [Microbacterium phage Nucci]QXO13633.1 hypothetical protein SEA_MANDALORIAN_41 [Microbacterium phage Mandalorian]
MFGEQPLPFVKYPFSKKSETLVVTEEDLFGHTNGVFQGIADKLAAERARLERLLPDPPTGYCWEFEQQSSDDYIRNTISFRVVATLKLKEI